MQKNTSKQSLQARICLLVLSLTLFLAACDSGYGSPSSPGGTPQATPTKGGYSMTYRGNGHVILQQYHQHLRQGK
ncbi:MAG: hypothetical protein NVSMB27_37640 [Ktedonobacteraceae bacterium]